MKKTTRPNILWIIADQLRADHVGFGGNSVVRTPNLDALAARGRVFNNAWVANPICMPNRCTMLTGRMPTSHGVIFNDRSLSLNSNTVAHQMKAAGYRTALIGKSHIQHGLSRNVVHEKRQAPTMFTPYPEGWDEMENAEHYWKENPDITDFYGFSHVEFAIGHADLIAGHHYQWALEKGATPDQLNTDWGPDTPVKSRYEGWWQIYESNMPEEFHSTNFVTERTMAWLEEFAGSQQSGIAESTPGKDEPFFLQCSFPDPHHPFAVPSKWWGAYDPDEMPVPATFEDSLADAPAHIKLIRKLKPGKNVVGMFGINDAALLRNALAAEYSLIEMLDEGIGNILNSLESLGLADNTIVVFTSDHGDMFGDHGLMLKATMHYQGCLKVPLVMAGPGITAGRTDSLASSVDLAQTFMDLSGVVPFEDMQGVSLTPVLDDPAQAVRDYAYVEEDFPLALHGSPLPLRSRTLVKGDYRLTRYSTGDWELFNLAEDPGEMTNLALQPEASAIRHEMAEQLVDVMMATAPMGSMG
ncbi:MAG: sulfatase-like hydrolase/transferase [Pseudomonadales bacterium]|nr:sulfatase-like hydrolase/transferase [Pseudomonadales bacterium]